MIVTVQETFQLTDGGRPIVSVARAAAHQRGPAARDRPGDRPHESVADVVVAIGNRSVGARFLRQLAAVVISVVAPCISL